MRHYQNLTYLENIFNMDKKEKIHNIIRDLKNQPNKDLMFAMEYLSKDFETTKKTLIELTKRLDALEITYNKVLEEYEKRKNGNITR